MNINEKAELVKALERDIEQGLSSRGYWEVRMTNDDYFPIDDAANLFRSIGRRVCRSRGWKVQTAQSKPIGDDGGVLVLIMVKNADAEHEKVWDDNRRLVLKDLLYSHRYIWQTQ